MNRTLHVLGEFRFAKSLLWLALFVAALSMSACGDEPDCEGAECAEPVACARTTDCELGTYCGPDFVCIADPCTEDTCERGMCERGSTVCKSKSFCEVETADVDCMFGEICQLGTCMDEQTFCDTLACKRGVCSFEEKKCVQATDCAGDSELCLPGSFCNEMGQCAPDLCEANEIECPDGGTCIPSLGACGNPEACSSSDDCLDDHICVLESGSLGTCLLKEAACGDGPGDGGCYGTKTCEYDPVSQLAGCQEAATCENALDCNEGRQCVGSVCETATACVPDAFEPNNDKAEATDFLASARNGLVMGTVCSGDSDFFLIDALSLSDGLTEGALLVDVQYEHRDVGLGEIELEVFDPNGDSLTVESSGRFGVNGGATALVRLATVLEGNYLARVSAKDDVANAGVRYSLSASFSTVETQEACMDAIPLVPGSSPVSANTVSGTSSALGSQCGGADNAATEVIFSFELEQRSAVSIYVIPDNSSTKLTASIRSACSIASSEVACQADVTNIHDTLSPLLEAGTYYLIVQGINGGSGGAFQVSMGIGAVQCTPASNTCVDEDTARICSAAGTSLDEVHCAAGCDPSTNACRRVEGDLCTQAIAKDEPFTATINWQDYRADINLSPSSSACVPAINGENNTGGPDAVWAVTIPPGKVLDATLTFASGEFGSMYILDSCADPSVSCLIGANRGNVSTERIGYMNETDADETVYLVADRNQYDPMTESTLTVDFLDVTCDPGEPSRCDANGNIESCNAWGTQYDVSTNCNFGCTDSTSGGDAVCSDPTNDTCSQPLELVSGVPVTAQLSDYNADHTQSCTTSSSTPITSGRDAVYLVNVTVPNTRVEVVLDTDFDAVLYVTTTCSTSAYNTCVDSSDRIGSGETVSFTASTAGSYYIFADEYSSSSSATREFTITATMTEPSCTPGEAIACDTTTALQVCDSEGFPTVEPCRGLCEDGACIIETGDTCEDPLPLAAGSTVTGDTGEFYPDYNLSSSSCTGYSARGNDMVYQIETTAPGQIIDLQIDADFDASLYVSRDCVASGGEPTCVAGQDLPASQNEHVVFVAHEAGTYFVYVDGSAITSSGTFSLSADVRNPTCTPGESLGCAGDELEFCGPLGEVVNYACSSTCTDAACDDPTGDVCQEAIVVHHGETIGGTVNASGSTNSLELNSGKNNQCLNGTSRTSGKEMIYRVDLLAGELLTVEIDTPKSEVVTYISESCVSAAQRCHAVDSNGKDGLLHYYATEDISVFVVVDATNSTAHNFQFTVDISSAKVCEPGGYRCLDADTLEVCNADGTEVLGEFICANGCVDNTCVKAPGSNSCDSAPSIGGVVAPNIGTGISVEASYADLSNSVSVPADGCTRAEGKGKDLIYQVDLGVDDVLEATVFSPSGENPMVYILTDCADADSCLTGAQAEDGLNTKQQAYTRYRSDSVQTVFVVADSANASASGRFRLDISVSPAECVAGQTACVDGENESFCNQGRYDEQYCMYGACTGGGCTGVAPDTCVDAQVVPNDGQVHVYRGLLEDLNNTIDLGDQDFECTGIGPSPGVDAIYAITLNPNEFLDVKVDSPADTIVWISESCGANMDATCADGVDNAATGASESLLFDARYGGTYYIIVDSASTAVYEGEYSIEIQARSNECTFGESECVDNFTRRRCTRDRLWEEIECYYGCEAGVCMDVVGDTCEDAIVVPDDNQPHVFHGRMEDYTKTTNVGDAAVACSGVTYSANGPEVFYAVQMNAGDIVDVAWTSTSDGQAWIASTCTDIINACLMRVDSGNPESFTYRAEETGTYYIVGDNYTTSPSAGEFTMEIHVRQPDCDPATFEATCIDSTTLQGCDAMGLYTEITCDCQGDECQTSCQTADDITAMASAPGGVVLTGTWGDTSNEFESYCGASSYETDGSDFFYIVDLDVGETVDVDIVSSGSTWPTISFMNSCSEAPENFVCLQEPASSTSSVSTSYTATAAGPVYILIDNDWPAYPQNTYTLTIEIH